MVPSFVYLLYLRHASLQPNYGLVLILKDTLELVQFAVFFLGLLRPSLLYFLALFVYLVEYLLLVRQSLAEFFVYFC